MSLGNTLVFFQSNCAGLARGKKKSCSPPPPFLPQQDELSGGEFLKGACVVNRLD